ncbi:MAG: hypothetical protein K8S87_02190 [Planctomycetes bacterium]|nr:hypothetical protein [Planctomycetota bacterium]
MTEARYWHKMYEQLGASPEVQMIQMLEPKEFDEDEEWAILLRKQFPTVPPAGIEMCHKNWLVGLDMLLECIGNEIYQRENYWCGDVPLETIMNLGLRRRILQFWLKGLSEDNVQEIFSKNTGESPNLVRVYYAILGDINKASFEIKQDIQNIVDILVGPFDKATEALSAKWRNIKQQQQQRNSILRDLDESVITCLCNYYSTKNIDGLVRMIAKQQYNPALVGGCNVSMKFLMQEKPSFILGSEAIVWASYLFVAADLGNKTYTPPDVIKDMSLSALEKLGNCTPVKRWLTASLGLAVKAWLKRAWTFMNTSVSREKLPNFIFDLSEPRKSDAVKTSKAPKLKARDKPSPAGIGIEQKIVDDAIPAAVDAEIVGKVKSTEIIEEHLESSELIPGGTTGAVSIEDLESLIDKEEKEPGENTITGAMTVRLTHGYITQKILESDSLVELADSHADNNEHLEDATVEELKKIKILNTDDNQEQSEVNNGDVKEPLTISIKKPDIFSDAETQEIETQENVASDAPETPSKTSENKSNETTLKNTQDNSENVENAD